MPEINQVQLANGCFSEVRQQFWTWTRFSCSEDKAVSVETLQKSSTVRKLAPRYRVLLHNDDYNPMEYVVQVLMTTIPSLTQPQAVDIMMEAHTNGIALVITCAQEHAEFYSETLKNHGLTSTIEPDE
jgi:ATP-dependent Clp protease adaptor protein ClpS